MKKITNKEASELIAKEKKGISLTEEENLQLFIYHGLSEKEAREALFVISKEYTNQKENKRFYI